MSWPTAVLAVANIVQVVALSWIAAWQQRAAQQVRRLNGSVEEAVKFALTERADARLAEIEPAEAPRRRPPSPR